MTNQLDQIYDTKLVDLKGNDLDLSEFKDQILLIVNVASKCGLTPQYEELESLYQKYKDQGLVIIGAPCNQFGSQEPGPAGEIESFCQTNYGVTFKLTEKLDVNGKGTHPLFKILKKNAPGLLGSQLIKWNFTKFLLGRNASSITRYAPKLKPLEIEADLRILL